MWRAAKSPNSARISRIKARTAFRPICREIGCRTCSRKSAIELDIRRTADSAFSKEPAACAPGTRVTRGRGGVWLRRPIMAAINSSVRGADSGVRLSGGLRAEKRPLRGRPTRDASKARKVCWSKSRAAAANAWTRTGRPGLPARSASIRTRHEKSSMRLHHSIVVCVRILSVRKAISTVPWSCLPVIRKPILRRFREAAGRASQRAGRQRG